MISKNKLKNLYVVEGVTDEDKLKKLGCTYVMKTGGKFIREDITSFLAMAYSKRNIVLVTDPDGPGRLINSIIQNRIGPCEQVLANKSQAIAKGKVGIAEMKLELIHHLLEDYLKHDESIVEHNITMEDFIDLGLIGPNGTEKREFLISKYHIPYTSGKKVLEALKIMNMTKNDISKELPL